MIPELRAPWPAPEGLTYARMAACADREVQFRERVYAKRVAHGAMPPAQAEEELHIMRVIAQVLHVLERAEATQTQLL